MNQSEIAKAFERIADLLEIDGGDRFRINSYRRVSRTLKDSTEDLETLAKANKLTSLPGVGKGTAERIQQFLDSGTSDVLSELEAKLPPGLPALLEIPGMGPKKVALVHDSLDVKSVDELKVVIESGALAELPGLGATSVKKISEGIAFLESSGGRTPLGIAWPMAETLAQKVRRLTGVRCVEIAGSLRRGKETIGDIDILCEADEGEEIIKQFVSFSEVKRTLAAGATKGSVTIERDKGKELQVDLRVVPTQSFGAAFQYFTGSKEHNVVLREIALKKKLRLNEYGLFDGERSVAGEKEEDIYRALGVSFVPPELREDRGEFSSESNFEDLLTLADIRGDLHMHTVASDGKNTIDEMAEAAKELGYEYIAICDHSKSSTIANGLSIERMQSHIKAIREANACIDGITILVGCECDILSNGEMDYPEDILAQCDWVVASIHAAMGSGGKKMSATERTMAAMENPYVCVIGHPTGRLINRRKPMDLNMAEVVETAKRTGTMLEINAAWQRLDLKDLHVRQAIAGGVMLSINTDAHRTQGFGQMGYGVKTARRGGAVVGDIANCLTLSALRKRISKKRP